MSPSARALLRALDQGRGSFYCQPCLGRSIGTAFLRTAWAEVVATGSIELAEAPCVECLRPRTVMRIRPTSL
jgi:hypothetical protein